MQMITKEDMIKMEERKVLKTDEWWENLSSKERNSIYDRYYDLFRQIKCKHTNLNKVNLYDINQFFCENCGISFTESEIRDQKIDEVLKGDN